jgi:hypothetical protein
VTKGAVSIVQRESSSGAASSSSDCRQRDGIIRAETQQESVITPYLFPTPGCEEKRSQTSLPVMIAVEVMRIGRPERDVPRSLVIDVAAIEVRRRWRGAEVGIGRITAGAASSRAGDLRLLRHERQRRLLTRCRLVLLLPLGKRSPSPLGHSRTALPPARGTEWHSSSSHR